MDLDLVRRIVCIVFSSSGKDLGPFALACYQFTPKIAIRAEEAIFLDITRSQKLFLESHLLLRLEVLEKRFGLVRRGIAFASDAPTALAMARFNHLPISSREDLPLEALLDYVSPFTFNPDLQKKVKEAISILYKLGLKNLGDFLKLPSSSLTSRFGKEMMLIRFKMEEGNSSAAECWPVFTPPRKVIEKCDLEEEVNLESIIFVLNHLVDRAMAQLRGMGKRASVVEVEFFLKAWGGQKKSQRSWKTNLPVPQGSRFGLIPILRERLSFDLSQYPLQAPVESIQFQVLETVPGSGAQLSFFDKKEEENELWNALVGRLAFQLGKESVFTASLVDRYLPEKAWVKKLLNEGSSLTLVPLCPRPARLLKNPESIQMIGNILIHPSGKRWRVKSKEGPERISGEWWRDSEWNGFDRDYYRVITENGEQLWIFYNRLNAVGFFLHGYFD